MAARAGARWSYIQILINILSEIITRNRAALGLFFRFPGCPAVGSVHIWFYGPSLPGGSVIQDGSLETGLKKGVRRSVSGTGVPLAPVREAAGCKFIAFHNLLGRNRIGTALGAFQGIISSGSVGCVKTMGDTRTGIKTELEDGLLVSGRQRFGYGVLILRFQAIAKFRKFIGSRYHFVITPGIEHGAGKIAVGHSPVHTSVGRFPCREVVRGKV